MGDEFHGQVLWYGGEGHMIVRPNGAVVDRFGAVLLRREDSPLPGRMNAQNLAAALLAGAAVMGDELRANKALARAMAAYKLPPQRLELVEDRDGVRWINDSVSTTPESTAASLAAVEGSCILITGGRDKGLDPSPLIEAARHHVRLALTVGEQGPALVRLLAAARVTAESVSTVSAAVARAARTVRPGETVLLSPGYSSHDQFTHYRQRGETFVRDVRRTLEPERLADGVQES
jgi:UDP-N-acetylmuramoylalanine--D-glutamate ligase